MLESCVEFGVYDVIVIGQDLGLNKIRIDEELMGV